MIIVGNCEYCSAPFEGSRTGRQNKRFCSKRCSVASANHLRSERKKLTRPKVGHCKECGAAFSVNPKGRVKTFCSELCTQKHWAKAHPEVIAGRRKKNYVKFGDHIRSKSAQWTRDNPEKSKERNRLWTKTETGRLATKAANHRRRAHRLNAEGKFTRKQFRDLCMILDCRCQECRVKLSVADLHADHIVPLSRGGRNDIGNIQPLCESCNVHKSDTTMNWLIDYALEGTVLNDPRQYGVAA